MKQYIVSGTIEMRPYQLTVEAETEQEAIEIAEKEYAFEVVFGASEW